ncbi:hypothetical protein ACX0G7_27100 [Flavitalea antarctica]
MLNTTSSYARLRQYFHVVRYAEAKQTDVIYMTDRKVDIVQMIVDEWRQLGFYYDFDERASVNQWRFFGHKQGLLNFVKLIDDYVNNENNSHFSEHEHYGPYMYLKIITLEDQSVINRNAIGGTIADLKKLKDMLADKIDKCVPGQTFSIDKVYGEENTVTTKFFVMADDFDPVTMDELIMSDRQKVVNQQNGM